LSFILKKVQSDYNKIAKSFSETRNKPWPEFELLSKIAFNKKYYPNPDHDQKGYSESNSEFQILDLACGNGRLFDFLNSKFSKLIYTGFDNSIELLAQAKQKYQLPNFQYGDILEISSENAKFDQIWCIAALHHIPKKYHQKAVKEMHRVLKQNGILVLTVWQLWQWKYFKYIIKSFLKNPFRTKNLFIPWRKGDTKVDRYCYAFTLKELQKTFQKSGFEIIDCFSSYKGKKIKPWWKGFNLCLVCQKTCES